MFAALGAGDDGGDDDPDERRDEGPEHKRANAFGRKSGNSIDHTSRRSGSGSGSDGGDPGSSELDDDKKWRIQQATIPPQHHFYLNSVLRAARLVNSKERRLV